MKVKIIIIKQESIKYLPFNKLWMKYVDFFASQADFLKRICLKKKVFGSLFVFIYIWGRKHQHKLPNKLWIPAGLFDRPSDAQFHYNLTNTMKPHVQIWHSGRGFHRKKTINLFDSNIMFNKESLKNDKLLFLDCAVNFRKTAGWTSWKLTHRPEPLKVNNTPRQKRVHRKRQNKTWVVQLMGGGALTFTSGKVNNNNSTKMRLSTAERFLLRTQSAP